MGRGFTVEDQAPGAEPVVVLTHRTWTTAFGGDAAILDTLVRLNGVPTRVIGVMPRGYGFPVATDAYVPIRAELLTATVPGTARLQAYARLATGVDPARAAAELTARLQRAYASRPLVEGLPRPSAMTVQSFQMAQIDAGPITFVMLNGLAALILLLACVNVTNLLLARANERARETAVRLALGASRARLIVQATWESVVLCVAGGALATALVIWALDAVNGWAQATLPGNLAFWWVWGYERSVLAAAAAFVTLTIVVLAAVASRRAVNTEINAVLQEGASRASSRSEGRIARALVVVQVVAVSLPMFFGTLSAVVAYRFVNIDYGYDTRNLLRAALVLPADRYPTQAARGRLFQSVFDRLAERAEVEGAVLRLPLADIESARGDVEIANGGELGRGQPRTHVIGALGPLTPLGIELAGGRFFAAEDDENAAKVALVSRAMAELYWPGRSPLGEQLTLTGIGESEPRTVVGIVGDVVLGSPALRRRSSVGAYVPLRQTDAGAAAVELRHRGSEQAARAAYHETLTALDPLLVSEVTSFEETLRADHGARDCGDALVGGVLGVRAAARRERHVRAHGAVDRPAHARDRRAPRARRVGQPDRRDAARAERAAARHRSADCAAVVACDRLGVFVGVADFVLVVGRDGARRFGGDRAGRHGGHLAADSPRDCDRAARCAVAGVVSRMISIGGTDP